MDAIPSRPNSTKLGGGFERGPKSEAIGYGRSLKTAIGFNFRGLESYSRKRRDESSRTCRGKFWIVPEERDHRGKRGVGNRHICRAVDVKSGERMELVVHSVCFDINRGRGLGLRSLTLVFSAPRIGPSFLDNRREQFDLYLKGL